MQETFYEMNRITK